MMFKNGWVKNTRLILIFILGLSFFLRIYNFKSFYVFSHDQDLASWIIKDILVNGHLRLIGQETSSQGVFIGALYYYLQIPFYLLGNMNPLSAVFLSVGLGVFATYSIYYVFNKIAGSKSGLVGAFIYAVSALIVFTDREVAPTMPVVLWSVWYLYSLYLVYKSDYLKGFALAGLLIGLVWHLSLALIILTPLMIIAFIYSKRVIDVKAIIVGFTILAITSVPLVYFEFRHNFSQTKAVYLSLTTQKDLRDEATVGFAKLDRVMQLVNKNAIGIFSKTNFIRPSVVLWSLVVLLLYFIKTNKVNNFLGVTFVSWLLLYVTFFSLNSLNVSEYYLNGMNIVWIFIASITVSEMIQNVKGLKLVYILGILFVYTNLSFIYHYNTDKKGYVEKMNLVKYIKKDSLEHNYPCISISYITKPGYNLGYRYLFYVEKMHVNNPISNSPVYTIVYPHDLVDRIDMSFGSLGLINPDYERYNKKDVDKSCEGQNSNLTDPMFGYTE